MIVLHVTHNDPDKIVEIAESLLKSKLITDVTIDSSVQMISLEDGRLSKSEVSELTAKTKALLFTTVFDHIKSLHPEDVPRVYSLPIVSMDWDQTQDTLSDIIQV